MLVSMRAVLDLTDAEKVTMGAFSITSLEGIQAVLGVAKELGQPVILQLAPVHKSVTPFKVIGPVMVMMAEKSSVPVCVHLGHGGKLRILQEALKMGFTSMTYDGSVSPFEENAADTKIAVETARDWGASVEAEFGAVRRQEFSSVGGGGGGEAVESYYTNPEQARAFTALTRVNALACLFSVVHGLYLTTPKPNFDRIHRIRESIGILIMMHGESGVSDEDFKKCIANGVRKTNYYTYLAKANSMYVEERCADTGECAFSHDVAQWAVRTMKEDMLHTTKVFSHLE